MSKTKPYAEGWETLSVEERIERWLEGNKQQIGKREEDFRNFLLNFDASYNCLDKNSLRQLLYELREKAQDYRIK